MSKQQLIKAENSEARFAALRRIAMRRQRLEVNGRKRTDLVAGERQARKLEGSEKTGKLAGQRIRECLEFPSTFAVGQLVAIAKNFKVPPTQRIEAAAQLLRISG